MPQIVSLLPAAAATPATTPGAPLAAAADTLQAPNLSSPNFLVQFKSALKNLASAVAMPQITAPRAPDVDNRGPLLSPPSDPASEAAVAHEPARAVEPDLPALLAELGFAMVPPTFVTSAAPDPVDTRLTRVAPQPRGTAQAALLAPPLLAESTQPAQTAPAHQTVPAADTQQPAAAAFADVDSPDQSDQPQPQPSLAPAPPPQSLAVAPPPEAPQPTLEAPQATLATPQPTLATAPELLASVLQAAGTRSVAQPPAASPIAPSPVLGLHQVVASSAKRVQADSASSEGTRDRARSTPVQVAPVATDADVVTHGVPVSDAIMLAAAATTTVASPQPTSVGPSAVVAQIARHADLIRLPNNRGLRIQLHPEDLGGVQVTLRYSPVGGVELHINAEHAATGALVQAGWSELRDSLATQGISSDRLVMTVTSFSGGGQADLSGRGDRGSDPSSYSPNQSGLSGQHANQDQSRQEPSPQRGPSWSGPLDPISSPDGNPRVASATLAPSRIDYRV